MSYSCTKGGIFGSYRFQAMAGASGFSAAQVWDLWVQGSAGNQAAGLQASNAIRQGLDALGYGPVSMNEAWGSSLDKAGYGRFAQENSVTPTSGMPTWWPNQQGLAKMEQLLAAGASPGGNPSQGWTTVGGQLVSALPKGANWWLLAALGVAAVGGGVLLAKRKKAQRRAASYTSVHVGGERQPESRRDLEDVPRSARMRVA